MLNCYFIDWTEPPVTPWKDCSTRVFTVELSNLPRFYDNPRTSDVTVWLRTDGVFVFSLGFKPTEKAIAEQDEHFDYYAIRIAYHASHLIKKAIFENRNAQTHVPDSRITNAHICVKPIKVSKELTFKGQDEILDADDFAKQIAEDTFLRSMNVKLRENESGFYTVEDEISALLLLRRQFGRTYEKALLTRQKFRDETISFRLCPKVRPIPGWASREIKFRVYSAKHVIVAWSISILLMTLYSIFGHTNAQQAEESEKQTALILKMINSIPETLWWLMGFSALGIILTAWYFVIEMKRGKTIEAYDKATTLLISGNYFHAVLSRIMTSGIERAKSPIYSVPSNFDLLIARLSELKRIENEKLAKDWKKLKWMMFPVVIIILTLLGIPKLLLELFAAEIVQEWLEVIRLSPTKRN